MIKASAASSTIPASLPPFGPPPLLEGEDYAAYNELLARISGTVKPADVLEEIWVRDVVDLTWEALRWRRLKTALIEATEYKGIQAILESMIPWADAGYLTKGWARGDADAINEVNKWIASANLLKDDIIAQALSANLPNIERIDRLTMNAEIRRNAALREIERHRSSFGQALRQASKDVVDAQFAEVKAPQLGVQ